MIRLPLPRRRRGNGPATGHTAAISTDSLPGGYQQRSGEVTWISARTRYCVHLRISGFDPIIEVRCSQYWVMKRGDVLDLLGRFDPDSGKFIAEAYYNRTECVLDAAYQRFECPGGAAVRLVGLVVAVIAIGLCAMFFTAGSYLTSLFFGVFAALWLGLSLCFGESRGKKQARRAWNEAVAVFRQNVGPAP